MKKLLYLLLALVATGFSITAKTQARNPQFEKWFPDKDLTTVGIYYYPEHWNENEWDRDLKKISDLGFEFVHFAEFAWVQLEPEEGRYDFAWLERAVALAAKHKLKVIMCTSTATPPVWLTRKHPEIFLTNENGTKQDHGARQNASFSVDIYKDYAFKMIDTLARHYGKDPRIMGWQLDNEPWVQFDYGKDAQRQFREFLVQKYGNDISKLNYAWGTAFWGQLYNDFSQINIPQVSQLFMNHHQILDYRRFAVGQTAKFLDKQVGIIKQYSTPDQWVTTNYIPNYEDGHQKACKNLDYHAYTRYMVFGENKGVGRKGYRVGEPLRIAFANDFFRPIDGLYGVMELQPGQVNWGIINPQPAPGAVRLWTWSVFAGGGDFVCAYRYRQPLFGTEQYHYGIVGTDGVTVTNGGKEYAQFISEIATLRKKYRPKEDKPKEYLARHAAILYNAENYWSIQQQKQNISWDTFHHINNYYNPLKSFGAPVEVIGEEKDFSAYPVMIVPAYQMADKTLVERLTQYAKNGGHLVLSCRTAQKERDGRLPAIPLGGQIAELIGAKIDFYDLLMPETPDTVIMNGGKHGWNTWGEILVPNKGTQVWATYQSDLYDEAPAVTSRTLGKGTVTYVGVDTHDGGLERQVLAKVYAQAGIPVMDLPYGVWVEYRNGMGIALNYSDKTYSFPVEAKAKVLIGEKDIPTAGVLVWSI